MNTKYFKNNLLNVFRGGFDQVGSLVALFVITGGPRARRAQIIGIGE